MPNVNEMNQELVRAFNISLCYNSIAITNLTVQNLHGKDHIVISFDKSMKHGQRVKYLSALKDKIIKRSYKDEKTANVSYSLQSFPFNFNKGRLEKDNKGKRFSVEIDEGVVFNLKCYLAQALAGDVIEKMGSEFTVERIKKSIYDTSFDRNSYLYCMLFRDGELQKDFVDLFSAKIRRYENAPSDYLEENGNLVYIKKSIFDDIEFIKDIEAHNASLICRHFQTPSAKSKAVDKLKYTIVNFMDKVASIPVRTIIRTSYEGSNEDSVLIPIVAKNAKDNRLFDDNDAHKVNNVFGIEMLSDVGGDISMKLPKSDSSDGTVYGVDFSDLDISYCVLNKIMESSVINKDHELAIDPELHFRALSPPSTPVSNEYSSSDEKPGSSKMLWSQSSTPTHLQNGSILGLPNGYLDEARSTQLESPTGKSQGKIGRLPRQGFIGAHSGLVSVDQVDVPGMSREFPPTTQVSYPAVSYGVSRPSSSSQSVGAAQNVQVGASARAQPMDYWSSPAPSAGLCSLPQSRPSSSKGANKSGSAFTSPWVQPIGYWSSQSSNLKEDCKEICEVFEEAYKKIVSGSSLSEKKEELFEAFSKEEKELFKALLYVFNLNNHILECPHTNFIVKNGKITSSIHGSVDVKEYLQKLRNSTIKEYNVTKEEEEKVYYINEFPFEFLSNFEKNQETTVVANVSRGALFNLKILFSQKFRKNVDAIDISAVKKVEKREKDGWVDRQLFNKDSLKEACQNCFPDEGAMKIIPIAFEGGRYFLDRSYDDCEVNLLFKEQLRRFRPLTEKEKELFKALLYAFNYSNNNFDCPDTNFIVKNGKIASLIPDSVNVKEYLQKVRDKTKKEYCKDEKETYDLNDFPFKFLSNCEKNQETTVVANMSRGALSNLKKFFIYGYEEKVKIEKIDINIVKEAVKSKRHRLIELKVKKGIEREARRYSRMYHHEAATGCYPDESALERIPIIKGEKGGYFLNRTFDDCETESLLRERQYTKGTSVAGKGKLEDNKDSGISSGEATDTEKVSSNDEPMDYQASSHVQQQNPCSDDEGNSRESSRSGSSNSSSKRSLELSVEDLRISTKLDATKTEQQLSLTKKLRSN